MKTKTTVQQVGEIESCIRTLRGQKVILDADLAVIYGVPTKALNQAVRRNLEKFPADFMLQLTREEAEAMRRSRSQSVTLKRGQNVKYLPKAFTEHGALMAATVLNSPMAVRMSLFIIRAFVRMRENLAANAAILKRLAEIDKALLTHDVALRDLYQKLRPLLTPPTAPRRPEIGYHTIKR